MTASDHALVHQAHVPEKREEGCRASRPSAIGAFSDVPAANAVDPFAFTKSIMCDCAFPPRRSASDLKFSDDSSRWSTAGKKSVREVENERSHEDVCCLVVEVELLIGEAGDARE